MVNIGAKNTELYYNGKHWNKEYRELYYNGYPWSKEYRVVL
jgi:hypothetical protein